MPLEALDAPTRVAMDVPGYPDQDYLYTLNFGPQHPATHTTLRLVLTLDGETIVKAVPDIGYLHTGFEKLGEDLDFNQYVTIVDRMNYISPASNEVTWHHVVEKLLGIELTPRATYLRTIWTELGRINDHLLCVGASALDLGAFTSFLYAFNEREKINNIFETASGQRFHPSWTRVGGLASDVTTDFIDKVRFFVGTFPKALEDVTRLLNRNKIFIDRTRGVGVLTKEEAINRSVTGPVARASGVTRDLRKDEPYLAYKDLDFKVVCATAGDCLSRYLVRMEEMKESVKIVAQCIENLPSGPVNVDLEGKAVIPDKGSTYRSIEGLIQHFELFMSNRQWTTPINEVYGATETANGELGYFIVSDGNGRGYRTRTRPPSFIHFSLFDALIRGHTLSDVVAVLGSLNIIAAELDR